MSCCGKDITKAVRVVRGNARHVMFDVFKLPTKKCDMADTRLYECWECEEQTWMYKGEYLKFMYKHLKEAVRHRGDLTKLPRLPKFDREQERAKKTKLFCRICKCFLPAKVYEEDETCPLGKW